MWALRGILILALARFLCVCGQAQEWEPDAYEIGTPVLQDIWVDPVNGHDANSGGTSNLAVRTVTEAWSRIPMGAPLTSTGYRLRLLPDSNIFDCAHLYFVGIHFNKQADGGDAFHLERCQQVLLRQCTVSGHVFAHETIKVNQSQHIYIEDCVISGAGDNAVDFVAVQYGHILRSRISDAGDWAVYVKGGSAQILIDGNEVFDAGTGGITAGQGTGCEFMTHPWLHYEAYDVKIVNNLIHDTAGAGLGVNGGYNILLAHNTLVRVGSISHVIEVVHGMRGCDGDTSSCESNRLAGGWGTAGAEAQYIPNRNVYIYNNIVYNPAPFQSQWQHFAIHGTRTPPPGSNVPSPAFADDNLRIRGNLIWNGPVNHDLLGDSSGCTNGNPTCFAAQLLADNHINTLRPQFVQEATGDYRPAITGTIFNATTFPIPDFPGGDRPAPPVVPEGLLANDVPRERNRYPRHQQHRPPGAYTGGSSMRMEQITPGTVVLRGEKGYRYAIEAAGGAPDWSEVAVVSNAADTRLEAAVSVTQPMRQFRARLLPP